MKEPVTEEQKKLREGFVRYEKQRGIGDTSVASFHLVPFFDYINSLGLAVHELGHKGAQEFQTWLTMLSNKDASPHYATLSVKRFVSTTSKFYDYLKSAGLVHTNPFRGIKRIRTERKLPRNIPDEKKMNEILEDLGRFWERDTVREQRMYYRAHVMAELQYATGMRIKEVRELEAVDIDFERKTIKVKNGKGGKERTAYLDEYASKVLAIYVREMKESVNKNKGTMAIFGISAGATIEAVYHVYLNRVCEKHGVGRFTSHNFRHSLGFHLLRRGCDMRYIQLILGHEDMNTTTIYTKVDKGDLRNELDRCHPRNMRSHEHD